MSAAESELVECPACGRLVNASVNDHCPNLDCDGEW